MEQVAIDTVTMLETLCREGYDVEVYYWDGWFVRAKTRGVLKVGSHKDTLAEALGNLYDLLPNKP